MISRSTRKNLTASVGRAAILALLVWGQACDKSAGAPKDAAAGGASAEGGAGALGGWGGATPTGGGTGAGGNGGAAGAAQGTGGITPGSGGGPGSGGPGGRSGGGGGAGGDPCGHACLASRCCQTPSCAACVPDGEACSVLACPGGPTYTTYPTDCVGYGTAGSATVQFCGAYPGSKAYICSVSILAPPCHDAGIQASGGIFCCP